MSNETEVEIVDVGYNATALEIVNTLTTINAAIAFDVEKDEDTEEESIVIKSADSTKSIAYIFKAPKEAFAFNGDSCTFYDFKEFYSLLNIFDAPQIQQDGVNLYIREGKQKVSYRVTDREMIKKAFNNVPVENPDVNFTLDANLVKKIKDLKGSVNAEYVKFTVSGSELTYTLYNPKHPVKFEDTFDVTNNTEAEFSMQVNVGVFLKIPLASYKVDMLESGLMRLTMIRDDEISVQLFTADNEDA
jgi:hypothetical protein